MKIKRIIYNELGKRLTGDNRLTYIPSLEPDLRVPEEMVEEEWECEVDLNWGCEKFVLDGKDEVEIKMGLNLNNQYGEDGIWCDKENGESVFVELSEIGKRIKEKVEGK